MWSETQPYTQPRDDQTGVTSGGQLHLSLSPLTRPRRPLSPLFESEKSRLSSDQEAVPTMTDNTTHSSSLSQSTAEPATSSTESSRTDSPLFSPFNGLVTESLELGFSSLSPQADATIPDDVASAPANATLTTAEQSLADIIESHLPNATGVPVELPNPFPTQRVSSDAEHDPDRNHGDDGNHENNHDHNREQFDPSTLVDTVPFSESEIEAATGYQLETVCEKAATPSHISTNKAQAIVHKGLLLMSALSEDGVDTPDPVWNIAGANYNPGDMKQFLGEKITACEEAGLADSFGWVNSYDHGGSVSITIIYSDMTTTASFPDDVAVDPDERSLVAASTADRGLTTPETAGDGPDDEQTLYFGNRLAYTYRGDRAITSTPLIYAPQYDTVIPLEDAEKRRRHEGDFMSRAHEEANDRLSPVDWHQEMIDTVSGLTHTLSEEIIRARTIAVDFDVLPFGLEEFYEYIGVPSNSLQQSAAATAAKLAPHTPVTCPADECEMSFERAAQRASHYVSAHESAPNLGQTHSDNSSPDAHPPLEDALKPWHNANPQPSVWTLQYALLIALARDYSGNPALDRYQSIQALAGEILRRPAQQIGVAFRGYQAAVTDTNSDPATSDTAAVTASASAEDTLEAYLDEFEPPTDLADATDLAGITEADLTLTATEQAQAEIQQRLNAFQE